MNLNPKFVHTNIIARDWKKLALFYIDVFECLPVQPERYLLGEWIEEATGIKNVEIRGIHLQLPGYNENPPTIEIFEYNTFSHDTDKSINQPGYAHIAFLVDNVEAAFQQVLANGGSQVGKIVTKEIKDAGVITFAYMRDPEGNILEIQNWKK